jgi:hypothetical protein
MKRICKYIAMFFLSVLLSCTLHATIPAEQTYGLYDAVIDGYKHLSPLHGFVAHEQKSFDNYYHCIQNTEPLSQLVHELFRFLDGTLKPHASQNRVGTYLDAATIGQLLYTIESNFDQQNGIITITQSNLETLLFNVLKTNETLKKRKAHKLKSFAHILIQSLDQIGFWGTQKNGYPKFLVHYLLLTLLFKRVSDKKEYITYFNQFKPLNNNKGILHADFSIYLDGSYNDQIIPNILKEEETKIKDKQGIINHWKSFYEQLAFAVIRAKYSTSYPPYISSDSAILSWHLKSKTAHQYLQESIDQENKDINLRLKYAFSNCMENLLANLISFIEYNSQTKSFKDSIQYFKKYTPQTVTQREAKTEWNDLLSDIPGLDYRRKAKEIKNDQGKYEIIIEKAPTDAPFTRPATSDGQYYYELKASISNLIKVINKLYNLNLKNFNELLNHFNLECPFFSLENNEYVAECKLIDNEKKLCNFSIQPAHASIEWPLSQYNGLEKDILAALLPYGYTGLLQFINLFSVNIKFFNPEHRNGLLASEYLRHSFLIQQINASNMHEIFHALVMLIQPTHEQYPWYSYYLNTFSDQKLATNNPVYATDLFKAWAQYAGQWNMTTQFMQKFESYLNKNQANPVARLSAQDIGNILATFALYTSSNQPIQFAQNIFAKLNETEQKDALEIIKQQAPFLENKLVH